MQAPTVDFDTQQLLQPHVTEAHSGPEVALELITKGVRAFTAKGAEVTPT